MGNGEKTTFSSIFLINLGIKGLIDFLLAPFLVEEIGYVDCFFILMFIYIIIGIISLYMYDKKRKDILFIESLKEDIEKNRELLEYNKLSRFIIRKIKGQKKKPFLILLLSFKNPGLAVIYMRKGYYLYNGFSNWIIFYFFLLNIFIMNLYFIIILYTGFSLWRIIF